METAIKTGAPLRMVQGDNEEPRCEFCKHWTEGPNQKSENPDGSPAIRFGKCSRFPPTMGTKPVFGPKGPAMGPDMQPLVNAFPLWAITGHVEVCGEFDGGFMRIPGKR